MIVPDASVIVELLLRGPTADLLIADLAGRDESLIAPHLLDVEVLSAFRRLMASGRVNRHRAQEFLSALAALPVERIAHVALLERIWELRHNFTAYDATYIALAEATNSVLYTCDAKLEKGHKARVVVFQGRRTPPN